MSIPNLGAMRAVADRLDRVDLPYAFVGGSVVNLLIDHPELTPARPTDDVDVVIDIMAGAKYSDVEARLRAVGFSHDVREGAPKCRWVLNGVTVDIMPTDGAALGLNTAWFAESVATATRRTFANSEFRIVSPAAFLATKYVAFLDRGDPDYYGSHDLEDFMTVVDGRAGIVAEIDQAPADLRQFVVTGVRSLLGKPELHDALPGYLPPDAPIMGETHSQPRAANGSRRVTLHYSPGPIPKIILNSYITFIANRMYPSLKYGSCFARAYFVHFNK